MFEWIIFFVFVIIGIVGIIVGVKTNWLTNIHDAGWLCGIISLVIAIFIGAYCFIEPIKTAEETNNFVNQKQYIETHKAKNSIEDAALTSKKIELNDWLYNAQYEFKYYRNWSFYSDDIKNLTPIK